jgi:hypothetical protein
MPEAPGTPDEDGLLVELHDAIARASRRPREIEVGIVLSIALGRRRGAVS